MLDMGIGMKAVVPIPFHKFKNEKNSARANGI